MYVNVVSRHVIFNLITLEGTLSKDIIAGQES